MEVPRKLLEELAAFLEPLIDEDNHKDTGGVYFGDDSILEAAVLHDRVTRALKNNELVVRKRVFHGLYLWWIGRGSSKNFTPYTDMHAPTGYGFQSRAKAERRATEIEDELTKEEAARQSRRGV